MPDSITTAFVTQFQTNAALLTQQKMSRLRGAVTPYALNGEKAEVLEQFGQTAAVTGLGRHADTPIIDVPQDRRWCFPTDADWGHMIDSQDKLRMLIDPMSPITLAGAAAMNRAIDDVIATAIFGTSRTGKDGSTSTALPASQVVANDVGSSTATGLNAAKLREARRILRKAEVEYETEDVFAALPADKEDDLFKETVIINRDYNGGDAPAQRGSLPGYQGIKFLHSERFKGGGAVGGSSFEIPVWCKNGVALGIWNDIQSNVSQVPTKRFNWLAYLKMTIGATRLEEARVVKILAT